MADADFAKGASGVSRVYDSSASGLGLSPAYLANMNANASAAAGSGGGEAGTAGVFASRPAAGDAINQFYYATDTGNLYFSNGTTWYLTPNSAMYDSDPAGGVLGGNYPNPSFAVDMATQAELNTAVAAAVNDGDTAGGVLSGTYPSPGFAVDMATQAELDAHINDTIDAHDASAISYVGGTGMSATEVESAIDELANEKANVASAVMDGDTAGGVLSGTYPSPGFAVDMATQAELDAVAALVGTDSGWQSFTGYGNQYGAYGSPWGPPQFRKLTSNLVIFRGLVETFSPGSDETITTIPAGYRCGSTNQKFRIATSSGGMTVSISSSGAIVTDGTAPSSGWISMNEIHYYKEN